MNSSVDTHTSLLILFVLLFPWSTLANESERSDEASESSKLAEELHEKANVEPLTPAQILSRAGLLSPTSCEQFTQHEALMARKTLWAAAITEMYEAHPEFVLAWITGQVPPPQVAIGEAELQKDCLLTGLVLAAHEEPGVRLVLSFEESFSGLARNARQVATQFEANPRWRRQVLQHLTRSAYRDAASQAHIWNRKLAFDGRSFNLVSEEAGQRCGIAPGQTWKPDSARHGRCWQQLSAEEREREILTASAAPGISRHHWGTDFDILSLNPQSFTERGPLNRDYVWLDTHALTHGFFQPFKGATQPDVHTHMEERWHWSYYPIAQALLDFIAAHDAEVDAALNAQWDALEARWNRRRREPIDYFPYIRNHWRTYLFSIAVP